MTVPQIITGIQLNFSGDARARASAYFAIRCRAAPSRPGPRRRARRGRPVRDRLAADLPRQRADGLAAWWSAYAATRETAVTRGRLDLRGVAALSVTMLLVMVPLVFGRGEHWAPWTWVSLAAGVPALAVFVALERRIEARGGHPLLNLHVVRRPAVAWGLAGNATATGSYGSMLFVFAVYFQQGLGKGPLYSGLVLLSWVAAFGLAGPLVRRVESRTGRSAGAAGAVLLAGAYFTLAATRPSGAPLVILLGLGGLGLGAAFSSMLARLTDAVPLRYAPDLSGLVVTSAQLAMVLGVAAFGTLYFALSSDPGLAFRVVTAALGCVALAAALTAWLSARGARPGRRRPRRLISLPLLWKMKTVATGGAHRPDGENSMSLTVSPQLRWNRPSVVTSTTTPSSTASATPCRTPGPSSPAWSRTSTPATRSSPTTRRRRRTRPPAGSSCG